jgi:hypothetical protein
MPDGNPTSSKLSILSMAHCSTCCIFYAVLCHVNPTPFSLAIFYDALIFPYFFSLPLPPALPPTSSPSPYLQPFPLPPALPPTSSHSPCLQPFTLPPALPPTSSHFPYLQPPSSYLHPPPPLPPPPLPGHLPAGKGVSGALIYTGLLRASKYFTAKWNPGPDSYYLLPANTSSGRERERETPRRKILTSNPVFFSTVPSWITVLTWSTR